MDELSSWGMGRAAGLIRDPEGFAQLEADLSRRAIEEETKSLYRLIRDSFISYGLHKRFSGAKSPVQIEDTDRLSMILSAAKWAIRYGRQNQAGYLAKNPGEISLKIVVADKDARRITNATPYSSAQEKASTGDIVLEEKVGDVLVGHVPIACCREYDAPSDEAKQGIHAPKIKRYGLHLHRNLGLPCFTCEDITYRKFAEHIAKAVIGYLDEKSQNQAQPPLEPAHAAP